MVGCEKLLASAGRQPRGGDPNQAVRVGITGFGATPDFHQIGRAHV